ncbi:hypothetical protein GCM10027199_35240 [Amycolatopsis magusensis]
MALSPGLPGISTPAEGCGSGTGSFEHPASTAQASPARTAAVTVRVMAPANRLAGPFVNVPSGGPRLK